VFCSRLRPGDPCAVAGSSLSGGTLAAVAASAQWHVPHRSGGANFFVNQHAADPTAAYALDITKVNALGFRAAGFYPAELSKYAVFGADVVAPCAGEVIAAENGVPNRAPLNPDSTDRAGGNHVVLYCQGHSVHLAHMDIGTVAVAVGDRVVAGQFLGRVGNSGNSVEPHLHISAVEGRHARFRGSSSGTTAERDADTDRRQILDQG
jgi:murein DD-endopeptidase MepM/ murein hydrolase activator NlpD